MRSNTQAASIDATPEKVFRFLADPKNLPRWAVGFAKSIRQQNGRWLVTTGTGDVGLRVVADQRTGVIDFWMSPTPGVEVLAASRVIPRGALCEYTFTQFHAPGMSDEAFNLSVQAITHELRMLKALLEVECPL